jgi:hypothetical protein
MSLDELVAFAAVIGALATTAYTIAFVRSMWLLREQLKDAGRSRDAILFIHIFGMLRETRTSRRKIWESEDELRSLRSIDEWRELRQRNPELAGAIEDVTSVYHVMGFYSEKRLLGGSDWLIDEAGETFIQLMDLLHPVIVWEGERISQDNYRYYLKSFEKVARRKFKRPAPAGLPQEQPLDH